MYRAYIALGSPPKVAISAGYSYKRRWPKVAVRGNNPTIRRSRGGEAKVCTEKGNIGYYHT